MKQAHLVIIGGVASGPAAAAEARRTAPDINITLFESGPDISYSACEMPHLLSGRITSHRKLIRFTAASFSAKYGVDVKVLHSVERLNVENRTLRVRNVRTEGVTEVRYDRLVLATGASAQIPVDLQASCLDVYTLRSLSDVQQIDKALKKSVRHAVVIGSGYVGLDAIWALHQRGIRTTLLAPSGILSDALDPVLGHHIASYLKHLGIQIRQERGSGIEKARDGNIIAVLTDSGEKIGCDFALVATGTSPNVQLAEQAGLKIGPSGGILVDHESKTSQHGIWACGDCTERKESVLGVSVRAPLSLQAFRSGRVAGNNAARGGRGRSIAMPDLVHAAAIGLGELEIAHTGWTRERAERMGKDAISVQATHRTASSLSEHHLIHVELVALAKTGRIIGAQIVGGPGSAARINVVTAIIRSKGTIDDVYNIDFIYAPTLAPAHDPLFVTARLLQKARLTHQKK